MGNQEAERRRATVWMADLMTAGVGAEEGRVASASEEICILAQFGTQDKDQNWVLRVVYLMKRGFHRVLKGKPWWGIVSLTQVLLCLPHKDGMSLK